MTRHLLRGGTVLTADGAVEADLLVEGGRIAEIGPGIATAGAEVLDCSGCWVGPGLVDIHVHFREPGQEWKEDVASGSAAAAAGGFTAVVAMPNTDPAIDAGHLAAHIADRGRRVGLVDVAAAGAISAGRAGERLAHLDELWAAGVRIFSDDGDSVADAGLLRRAMEYLADLGGVVAQHAEDRGLSRDGHLHEGTVSARLGIVGIPAEAEEVVVARDLALARMTGAHYHVQHVSTAGTVALVRAAKDEGLAVTAEVAPHHLALDHTAALSTDPAFKMYPPLRTADDAAALREALADGTIDAVATDHAPHAAHEKDVPFEEAPRGVIGLETAV
ncbi:MAG TPA: dihydroorotase, partial [Acidimicrobiia bacterium]|nr:dihydroorotase [Acidimicrobiia bacterium]